MTRKGPVFTLVGGGGIAVVLLIASMNAAGGDDDADQARVGDETGAATASADATPADGDEAGEEAGDDADGEDPATYVGWVDGGDASVAVIVDGDEATAYVCDGDTVEAWLSGDALNGELLLDGDDGSLTASYDDEEAEGETAVGGEEWSFAIEHVAPPEGLYRFADTVPGGAEVDGGWIVLPDGTQVGVLTVDGDSGPAPALDPDTGQVTLPDSGGTTVTAQRQG